MSRALQAAEKALFASVSLQSLFVHRDLVYDRDMRGDERKQTAMFSYVTLAQRIPADHPARGHGLLSEEHFTVDGTLIQAWAAARIFKEKADPPAPGAGSGHKGEVLLRDKVESKTDKDARLYKKATADKSVPAYQGHALTENRNGLVVAEEASQASTAAERNMALKLLDRAVGHKKKRQGKNITPGADTQYQEEGFVQGLGNRKVAPHVSEYVKGNLGKNCLTGKEQNDPRRSISQRKRRLIDRVFGWGKLNGALRHVKARGLDRVDWLFRLTMAAYNLVRMRRLIPIDALAS